MATCRDTEGWNIVSRIRPFDLTLCFEEGILFSSLYALLLAIAAAKCLSLSSAQISRRRSLKSRWILAFKILFLALAFSVSVANLLYAVYARISVPVFQSYIFESLSLAAAVVLTFFNHTRARNSSTILLIYWPLHSLVYAIWTRTVLTNGFNHILFTFKSIIAGLGVLSSLLECVGPEWGSEEKISEGMHAENPIITANVFSRWFFMWMTPLMKKGASEYISENDLPSLRPEDASERLGQTLHDTLQKHSLWKALFISYGGPYALAAGMKLLQDCLSFLQPQLLRWLLSYISIYQSARYAHDSTKPHPLEGFLIAVLMFVASVAQTVILNQYFQVTFETGLRVRSGLVSVIYTKALVLSNDERGRASGDIVNLMSVDATRLQDFCQFGLISISGPFQITLAFISLYNMLGWPAFVGVAIMLFSVPLNTFIARILKRMQETQMKNRDMRTRLMSELLSNIKSIKLYAWEYAFLRKILTVRNEKELKMLRKIGIATSLNMVLWTGIPLLVAFSSFAVAALTSSKPLTSDFSQVTSNLIEAIVSIRRLSDFLEADELQADARKLIEKPNLQRGDTVLSIRNADFSWSAEAVQPVLEDINLTVRKGELLGVLGKVGCGKTSLLSAIIGDMTRKEGDLTVYGTVAYCPQNPWILSATVRDNILFSHEYDEVFYNLVIEACALVPDLALLPQGDLTEVGEKGNLAVVSELVSRWLAPFTPVQICKVLLDDCLAAVDSHVARHIFTNVIGPQGILASKARILVTNSIAFVREFDELAFIRRGIVLEIGSYDSLMSKPEGELSRLVHGHGRSSSSSGTSTPFITGGSGAATPKIVEEDLEAVKFDITLSEKLRDRSSFSRAVIAKPSPTRSPESTGLSREHMEQGRVKTHVYSEYIRAASKTGFSLFLAAIIAQQASSVLGNLVLRSWGEHNREMGSNAGMLKYLIIYGAVSLSSILLGGAAAILMWVLCSLRSAKRLHDAMLESLMHAPLSFFELTPTGRILNLFSRDTYVVDQILARAIQNLCRTLAVCVFIVLVIGSSFPLFLLSVIPLGYFYLQVMKYYLATSRELKRLDAVSRSPIFAWFSESLAGLSTIRAFNQGSLFIAANQRRVDRNQICYLSSISVNRWLSVRLEAVGATIIFLVATLVMAALITTGVDAGLVGLVLSYALNATSSLNWVVRSASEVEQNIVSVERILHQSEVVPEAPHELPDSKPDGPWPSNGGVEFSHYSTRYRPDLDPVLKDITMTIKPSEKIGLLLALFRIIEPTEGTILIDGVDITKIGLHDLRSSISIVPQSPDLFEGTLRENIDPVGEHVDADIWVALGQAHLKTYVESLPEGLDAPVREGGSSLSSGQRQLLCFARALLRKSKVLVLDEATSAVDLDTDQAIQDIIRGPAFTDVTILTIAHRLNTIIESDRVLVMEAGKMAEFDTPQALLSKQDSIFYSLASQAGLVSEK
ncbi:related to YCF1-Vacuolar ABC transporter responsible for vacuolar sequestration of glutathione-S-conjugates [Armillaria ostoyae]|uniref:Related to YCF1-Vacuolar ABC transporter responsible for vacuolar sequestration of glutathione-S-conjugates n=1 Tax=Armillaria ostoyae TaxID=47428 RepID=A0A284R4E3_ARMOS|nr:related to YCF1-Vacuolar ABC transporter responsible for vacuolar sequestration of glutathione-S-conjugates [Armillaria ostoyae]